MKKLLLLFGAVFLAGCATSNMVVVKADSIGNAPISHNCAILPLLFPDDPFVKSAVMAQVKAAFNEAGYREARSIDQVDQVIRVGFKEDSMEVSKRTVTRPIYAQTGGGTTTFHGYAMGSRGGYQSFSGTAYSPPQYGVVGVGTQTYHRYTKPYALIIDAVDGQDFFHKKNPRPLWMVQGATLSIMDRSEAVRAILAAMIPSIGKNFSLKEIYVKPPKPAQKTRKPLSTATPPQYSQKLKQHRTSSSER